MMSCDQITFHGRISVMDMPLFVAYIKYQKRRVSTPPDSKNNNSEKKIYKHTKKKKKVTM